MVGKRSGKALLREEGLERTDNNMDLTSWPQIPPINQKNYYTEYLKRDDQILAYRLQQEETRNRMTKQAKDRDRALAQGRPVGPDGDVEMEEGDEDEDEMASGTKTIVIHLGSQNMRIGLGSDALPKTVPMCIARRSRSNKNESEQGNDEPRPKRQRLEDGSYVQGDKVCGEQFAQEYNSMTSDLKTRMRMNKRRVLPNSKEMVVNFNRRTPHETINELNDPLRIDWTEIDKKIPAECIFGKAALRIPDKSVPRYKLSWPIQNGWINEKDYNSKQAIWQDISLIIQDAVQTQLGMPLTLRRHWEQYSCVFVIPDLYDRTFVIGLLEMAMTDLCFSRTCFIQESLAASFGAGYTTTCIVDMGAQKTSICCVEDGMCIEDSRVNLKYGGADVTDTFIKMLLCERFPYPEINLRRRYDWVLAEELKQRFCTMDEANISVQLSDFHLRASGQDTRKYSFKCYDEPMLAPMGFFRPGIYDFSGKLEGRRKLISPSFEIYEGARNDPLSSAQAEIMTAYAAEQGILNPPATNGAHGTTNGVNSHTKEDSNGTTTSSNEDKIKPLPLSRIQDLEATPHSSVAGSPERNLESTPPPSGSQAGSPAPDDLPVKKKKSGDDDEPLPIEYRDDFIPSWPLHRAIQASVIAAAKGSPSKTRDFFGGIMLIGGSSVIPNLDRFLEEQLQVDQPSYAKDIMIGRPPRELDAQVVSWKGASVFGKLSRTNDSWVERRLWEVQGERALAPKCMWAW